LGANLKCQQHTSAEADKNNFETTHNFLLIRDVTV
jgi:hypothetical protein